MNQLKNLAKKFSEKVYKTFSKNSGNMLLATGIAATVMSSLAQTGVILTSKKYSPNQKAFMVPQELMECVLSIGVMFAIAKPVQKLTLKLVKTGKLTSKNLLEYMQKNGIAEKRGKSDFDFAGSINEIINRIEKSDKFISASSADKDFLLKEHKKAIQDLDMFSDASSAVATTSATALSAAAAIPVIRNKVASYYQNKRGHYWEEQAGIYRNRISAKSSGMRVS